MRIHIENDLSGPVGLTVAASRLADRLAGIADLVITERSSAPGDSVPPGDFEVLLAGRPLNLAEIKAANAALCWVQILTAGAEAWLPGLPAGVTLANASGVHAAKGGEFVLAACLMLNLGIPGFVADQQARAWRPSFGGPIAGRTITLVGVGGIGRAAAAALHPFGATLIGVSRSGRCDAAVDLCLAVSDLDSVLPRTDILVLALPLTAQTRGLIDRRRLELLPRGAGVVNVGRGAVLDCRALAETLTSGRLGGAVLDVFPVEPLPADDGLWACPRLIITPHCSLDDHAHYIESCLDIFCDNVARFAAGEPLANVVDPARGY